jgi:uncharacterized protein (DUF2141 family)
MKPLVTFFALLFLIQVRGQDSTYTIYGEINVTRVSGTLFITLVDEYHFNNPQSGLDTLIIPVSDEKIPYLFEPLPAGKYGIRCFQDLNGNGKLDKGMVGPKEPWALSWTVKKRFPPKFSDISFPLHRDHRVDLKVNR